MANRRANVNDAVVRDFGREWERFDQVDLSHDERSSLFEAYFALFPWDTLRPDAVGFDAGCGTGRWALLAAPRVGHLHCIDPSSAITVAARNLAHLPNCSFHRAAVEDMPLADASMEFGYSLGVLHHVPDTAQAIRSCVRKLKPGAPFLVYLYYAFDNQPLWFRALWRLSDGVRTVVSRLPHGLKVLFSETTACVVYWPLARTARWLERRAFAVHSFPLSAYRDRSFYTMRTDALDRFGTRLERRFTRQQIVSMMEGAGLRNVKVGANAPFWCAVGYKAAKACE
jgi:ubiquinone/menaquinone biosynthesis C-methylase UbiE